jgi:hypothetical protein
MKKLTPIQSDERGFIPLILSILAIVVVLIIVVYLRVSHAGK